MEEEPTGETEQEFPADTAIADMDAAEQLAYWKHKARKHESAAKQRSDYDELKTELEKLRSEKLTAEEQAIAVARDEGVREGSAKAAERLTRVAVRAEVRAVIASSGVAESEEILTAVEDLIGSLDVSKLATEDGVDTERIAKIVRPLVASGSARQGHRDSYMDDMRNTRQGAASSGSIASMKKQIAAEKQR